MPEIIIPQRFAQRRGTPAEWANGANILFQGEIGFELNGSNTALAWKVGDGVTPWATLPYFASGGSGPVELRATSTHIQWRLLPTDPWINLTLLSSLQGPPGPQGNPGPASTVPGPVGPPGPPSTVPGPVGPPALELSVAAGFIRWREIGGVGWTNLVALSTLQGPQGVQGVPGLSAYQVAAASGFGGTQAAWLATLVGPIGLQGIQGPPGISAVRRIQNIPNTSGGVVNCDWNAFDEIRITLTTNTTLTFSGALDGQGCILKLKQDSVGGRTVALPAIARFNSLITIYTATPTVNRADKVGFVFDGTDTRYDIVSIVPGI